jgi:hypothetical protein
MSGGLREINWPTVVVFRASIDRGRLIGCP